MVAGITLDDWKQLVEQKLAKGKDEIREHGMMGLDTAIDLMKAVQNYEMHVAEDKLRAEQDQMWADVELEIWEACANAESGMSRSQMASEAMESLRKKYTLTRRKT